MALLQSMQSPAQSSSSLKRTAPKSPVAAGEPLVTGSPQLRCKPFDASPHRDSPKLRPLHKRLRAPPDTLQLPLPALTNMPGEGLVRQ
mmetsp:Transcript_14305/g.21102  ORF Transcript_14305/g.21102 Transcript_14305/m.21102 type:complete len:88 (-) Transcript_14305:53-316(-)